jgi:hypothetical protein
MNILHTVEFYSPHVGGAQEVVKQISERLARRGHSVTVATTRISGRPKGPVNGVHVEEFAVSGNEVSGFRGEVERYQDFLLGSGFDIMMNYAAQQWPTWCTRSSIGCGTAKYLHHAASQVFSIESMNDTFRRFRTG